MMLAASLTSGVLIEPEMSLPSRKMPLLETSIEWLEIKSAASEPLERSIPEFETRKADALYMAPVSRYSKFNSAAIRFAVVLLPEAAGPSTAIISGSQIHTLSL